jgi:pimeloyl-ACP methyl ester carboxylesterase
MKVSQFALFALALVAALPDDAHALAPQVAYAQTPDAQSLPYQEHTVKTADGATLKAWYFPAEVKSTRVILLCHNGEGNMADYLARVAQLRSGGYNVLTFDYRGFGGSSAFPVDPNMYIYPQYTTDVAAMIDFARANFAPRLDVYGWGIGAGLALGVGWNRPEVRKIVADTPFLSLNDLEQRFNASAAPMAVPFAGYDNKFQPLYAFDTAPTVPKGATKAALLIVGSNDLLYPVADLQALKAKQPKAVKKDVYVVQNPGRLDNFAVDPAAYASVVLDFLNE